MPTPNLVYPEHRELITVGAAATALRSSRQSIYNWVKRGALPCVNVYGRIMIDPTVIPDFRMKLEARESLGAGGSK